MRSSLLLLLPLLSVGCAGWLQNNQTEWTTAGGDDDAPIASATSVTAGDDSPFSTSTSTPIPSAPAPSIRTVTLIDGQTTLGAPLGLDTGPGPILVQPISGGPPQPGFPVD